jgi:hypothetical protein
MTIYINKKVGSAGGGGGGGGGRGKSLRGQ